MILPSDFEPLWAPPDTAGQDGLWFVFHRSNLLVYTGHGTPMLPMPADVLSGSVEIDREGARFVGMLRDTPVWAARSASDRAPAEHGFENMRGLFNRLPDDLLAIGGRAVQMLERTLQRESIGRVRGDRSAATELEIEVRCREGLELLCVVDPFGFGHQRRLRDVIGTKLPNVVKDSPQRAASGDPEGRLL